MKFSNFLTSVAILVIMSCSVSKSGNGGEKVIEGKISRNQLSKDFLWFEDNYNRYKPNDTAIAELNKFSKDMKVVVVMGTWCDDSKTHVPAFFKVADKIFMEDHQIVVIGVNRDKKCKKVDITKYKITNVPTFIVYIKGELMGSIIENPHQSIEKDLVKIIHVMNHQ